MAALGISGPAGAPVKPKSLAAAAQSNAPPLADQVTDRIRKVNTAYDDALSTVMKGGLFGIRSDADRTAENNIRQLRDKIDAWAAKGKDAAAVKGVPNYPPTTGNDFKGGWGSWIQLGNLWIDSLAGQASFSHATLDALLVTVSEIPQDVEKKAAKIAGAVKETASVVGSSIVTPLLIGLGVAAAVFLVAKGSR